MRMSRSIAPNASEQDTFIVLDDFGHHGRSWRETNESAADRETVIRDMLAGEYNYSVRVVAFNAAEGWLLLRRPQSLRNRPFRQTNIVVLLWKRLLSLTAREGVRRALQ